MDYNSCLEYATLKHKGQTRKNGEDYIVHPLAVAEILKEKGYGLDYQVAGLFHDLLEDTDATCEEILNLSNGKVLKTVKLLTKEKGYVMEKYITDIFKDGMAREVKMADRLNNLRDAIYTNNEFKIKYINETTEFYYPLITNSDFEPEIIEATTYLANSVK